MPTIITRGAASAQGFGEFSAAVGGCDGTKGIFALGYASVASTTRNKYTYACCTSTACGVGAASATSYNGSAAGNSTRGIFALGYACFCGVQSYSAIRNKYTYACCTSTACGVGTASIASDQQSAAGNSTRGIFAIGFTGGSGVATRNKYTYASDTSTATGVGSASSTS